MRGAKGPAEGLRAAVRQAGYELLNIVLHLAHQALVVFTIVGWEFCQTRLLHIVMMALIGFSWFGLGYFRGLGYCLITDIQWRVRERMGMARPAHGYVKFLADRLTGRDLDAKLVDTVTYSTWTFCSAASILLALTLGTC